MDGDECKTVCYSNSSLSKNNSFKNLFGAINIYNIYFIPFSITNTNFYNNATSIEIAYSSDIAIKDNTFTLSTTILNSLFHNWINANKRSYFIKTNQTQRFIIRENYLSGTGDNIYSINIEDCLNDQSDILANHISNSNNNNTLSSGVRGIYLNGKCNFSVLIPNRQNIVFYTPVLPSATINYNYYQTQYKPGFNSISNHQNFQTAVNLDFDVCTKTCNQLKNLDLVNSKVSIFPNPNKEGLIFFHNPYNKIYEITIYNNVGQIVYQSNSVINKIDVKLKSGIYYVQCKYQGIYETEKLIVE